MKKSQLRQLIREEIEKSNKALYKMAENTNTNENGSCSCGVKYVKTKKSDIPYDTDDNVYYTDIMIYHCPKCGNIDRIEEY